MKSAIAVKTIITTLEIMDANLVTVILMDRTITRLLATQRMVFVPVKKMWKDVTAVNVNQDFSISTSTTSLAARHAFATVILRNVKVLPDTRLSPPYQTLIRTKKSGHQSIQGINLLNPNTTHHVKASEL